MVAEEVHADYIALYSLSEDEDSRYTVPLTGLDGKRWYREESAILDLGKIDRESIMVVERPDGDFEIALPVEGALNQYRLQEWSAHQMHRPAGFVLNGRLMEVQKLTRELSKSVSVGPFATREEAEKEAAIMRRGGFGETTATQPRPGKSERDAPM